MDVAPFKLLDLPPQAVLDVLPANVAVLDAAGVVVAVNRSWRRFAEANGYAAATHGLGEDYLAVCHAVIGDDAETGGETATALAAVLAGERDEWISEYPCHEPSGVERWFRMYVRPLDTGTFRGAVVMHIDITARVKAEQRAQATADAFRAALAEAPVPVLVHDRTGRVHLANREWVGETGHDATHAPTVAAWQQLIAASAVGDRATGSAAAVAAGPWTGIRAVTTATGERRLWDFRTVDVAAGATDGLLRLTVAADVTDRARLAGALRLTQQVIDHSPYTIAVVDRAFRLRQANRRCTQALRLPPARIIGRRVADLVGPETFRTVVRPLLTRCFAGAEVGHEGWFDEPAGRRYRLVTITPLAAPDGTVESAMVVTRDLTERKRAEDALRHRYEVEHLVREVAAALAAMTLERVGSTFDDILERLVRFTGVERALFVTTGATGPDTATPADRLPWLVARLGQQVPVALPDRADLPPAAATDRATLAAAGLGAVLLVPLAGGPELRGALGLGVAAGGRRWTRAELDLLQVIASVVASALERCRVQAALRAERLWLESLIDATPDIVCLKDGDGRWLIANRFTLTLNRLDRVDYVGQTDRALAERSPVIRATLSHREASDRRTWALGRSLRYEDTIPLADGTERVFDLIKVPLYEPDGRRKGLVVVGRDITDHKRVETALVRAHERVEAVFEGLDSAIFVATETGDEILFQNQAARRLCGDGRRFSFPCDAGGMGAGGGDGAVDPCAALTGGAGAGIGQDDTWTCRDPATGAWYQCHTRPIRWADGRAVRLVMATEVSQRIRAEQALAAAKAEAEAASQAKSCFLAAMSHELRTPLNTILGFAEIIRTELSGPVGTPVYRDYADHIGTSGRHLLALISDILDISKIEAGKLEIAPEAIAVDRLLAGMRRLQRDRAVERGLALELDFPEALPQLWADERAVKQMLFNLLSNAIKFTPAGGRITLGAAAAPDGGIVVSVTDTGIGIPPDQRARILKPFEQADNRYGRSATGTGLGLALVVGLLELHHGRFTLDSTVGVGTRVELWFPPADPAPPAPPALA